jgi:hypothetical protein
VLKRVGDGLDKAGDWLRTNVVDKVKEGAKKLKKKIFKF